MILKGSQRGGARNLAAHLLNDRDNDHVELAEIRGLAARDLEGAFLEIDAISRGTKATQPFFSVSISPPANKAMTREDYAQAMQAIEEKFGLEKQPRAVVFHEKNARAHAHVVWSRIDAETMRAINLPYSKLQLREVSQELHRVHGLPLPDGLHDRTKAAEGNFTRPIWQQAHRLGEDPRDLKRIIGEAYKFADSAKAFNAQLETNAMALARGDRRGFVVVHHSGEALPLARYLGLKQKDMRARLGDVEAMQTIDQARSQLRARMTAQAEKQLDGVRARHQHERKPVLDAVQHLRREHRAARDGLNRAQEARTREEELQQAERLRKGIGGFWQRLTGERGRIVQQNKAEQDAARTRNEAEREKLRRDQMDKRRQLQKSIDTLKEKQLREWNQQRAVLGHWLSMDNDAQRSAVQAHAKEIEQTKADWRALREKRNRERGLDRERS